MTGAEFINKAKEPAVFVTIVLACLAGGFTVGYNLNGTYIKGLEDDKNDLQSEITNLMEQNKNLQTLHGNISFGDFLKSLNEVANNILLQQKLSDRVEELTAEVEKTKQEIETRTHLLQESKNVFTEKTAIQSKEIDRLQSVVKQLKDQIYASFEEPIVKAVREGESIVFYEPDFAIGLRDVNTAAHTATVSYKNVHEKEVAIGENTEVDMNGKQCFVRFVKYEEIGLYKHEGTFAFYCTRS